MASFRASSFKGGLLAVCSLLISSSNAAVTWVQIGCAGVNIKGTNVDGMWDNAVAMAKNANTQIDNIVGAKSIKPDSGPLSNIADNSHFLFDTTYGSKGLTSDSSSYLTGTIKPVYTQVQSQMAGNNGFLICNDAAATFGPIGGFNPGAWYYSIPGTQDHIILRYTAGNSNNRPCSDTSLLGQTFTGVYQPPNNAPSQEVRGVLICFQNFPSDYVATLPQGFTPSGSPPNPDNTRSVSGTILHEMVHVIDINRYTDQRDSTLFPDGKAAYGFTRCALLSFTNQASAQLNPDNYRIFAELAMSPQTRWGTPTPKGQSLPAGPAQNGKRSAIERAEPRRSAPERRVAPITKTLGAVQMNYAGELGWAS